MQRRKGLWSQEEVEELEVRDYCDRVVNEYGALLAFEGLSAAPEPTIRKLLDYLGVQSNQDLIKEVATQASFERVTGRSKGRSDKCSYFRKGVVGRVTRC